MKRLLIIVLGLSLLLVSCTTKYVCPDGTTVADPVFCPQLKPESTETIPVINPTNSVEELLAKSKNVESISYDYKRMDKPLELPVKIWLKKVTVKRELNVQTEILNKNEMDVVIFNVLNRSANAYCESKKYCIKTGDAGAVDYDQYYIKTPLDWIDGVTSATKKGEARLVNRDVWVLQLEGNVTMWVDTFFGVPLRVDNSQERHEFQNPTFNGVTDAEVQYMEKEDRYG